ncbi:hypothetical protein GX51_00647 [Blastomyces parvus]|uniref:Retroviral polymerase SH3-like domain-containing protein n=1 Tax=Blastomyces parvus TaxID=2060905 RepID=A0A2B7XL79_9EURO|nr:hypothetical protein GX51_00647 [Blastomyces parvus]
MVAHGSHQAASTHVKNEPLSTPEYRSSKVKRAPRRSRTSAYASRCKSARATAESSFQPHLGILTPAGTLPALKNRPALKRNFFVRTSLLVAERSGNLHPLLGLNCVRPATWLGALPSARGLQQWGCRAFLKLTPKPANKLESRSKELIFAGYEGFTNYCLIDQSNSQLYVTKDVIFREDLELANPRAERNRGLVIKIPSAAKVANSADSLTKPLGTTKYGIWKGLIKVN